MQLLCGLASDCDMTISRLGYRRGSFLKFGHGGRALFLWRNNWVGIDRFYSKLDYPEGKRYIALTASKNGSFWRHWSHFFLKWFSSVGITRGIPTTEAERFCLTICLISIVLNIKFPLCTSSYGFGGLGYRVLPWW